MSVPMKTQDEAFAAFQNMVSVHGRPEAIVIDNGSTLLQGNFSLLTRSLGIQVLPAVPGCKGKTSRVERAIQTLRGLAACYLAESGLPVSWWHHAIRHAAFVHSVTHNDREKQATPFYVRHKKPYDLRRLPTFGCRAHVLVDEEDRPHGKQSLQRRRPAIYLGEHEFEGHLYLHDVHDNRLSPRRSRDVKFETQDFPARTDDVIVEVDLQFDEPHQPQSAGQVHGVSRTTSVPSISARIRTCHDVLVNSRAKDYIVRRCKAIHGLTVEEAITKHYLDQKRQKKSAGYRISSTT